MEEAWSVLRLLKWTTEYFKQRGIESGRREAEDLLGSVLELDRLKLYLAFENLPSSSELKLYRELVARRAKGEPLQYLLGWQPFLDLKIKCDARALIPRPETERLAELAIERLVGKPSARIADLGTGTGCIALAILKASDAEAWASDASAAALDLALENAKALGLEARFHACLGDFLEGLPEGLDLIVSNPPYIPEGQRASLAREVKDFEPSSALFSGPEGLDALRQILKQAPQHLRGGACLLLECGEGQAERLKLEVQDHWAEIQIHLDPYQVPRFLLARTH